MTLPPPEALAEDLRTLHDELASGERLLALCASMSLLALLPELADYFERQAGMDVVDVPVFDLDG